MRASKDLGKKEIMRETKDFELFNKWEAIRDLAGLIVVMNLICYMLLMG